MKPDAWKIIWGIALLCLSAIFYVLHYMLFRDPHHLFIFFVGDVAFVFVEVLLVTMILHQLLDYRDKKAKIYKMNMVIGAFFSEVGTELLRIFSGFDKNADQARAGIAGFENWLDRTGRTYKSDVDIRLGDLKALQDFFLDKRPFMLILIQNSNLLEHDRFSDLLWAIFHLAEELLYRERLEDLSEADLQHIQIDIERAHAALLVEWFNYMRHLRGSYPHLFSLSVRMNPFDPKASPEIRG